ncbi:electron carrier/ protein disulfide oxidoreductase [Anaeramoeba flamelloides]|uniref:Electron carrier/ protein disulfide oxidoreductase n=1 Tax=Anaeramoeba flamelloides TaxID=1746091 RepID=A0AAV7YPL0_9EUKA|nr:electron carrier/ protein disulfide oxidoreductase [Anaeramoeba flamelloides]
MSKNEKKKGKKKKKNKKKNKNQKENKETESAQSKVIKLQGKIKKIKQEIAELENNKESSGLNQKFEKTLEKYKTIINENNQLRKQLKLEKKKLEDLQKEQKEREKLAENEEIDEEKDPELAELNLRIRKLKFEKKNLKASNQLESLNLKLKALREKLRLKKKENRDIQWEIDEVKQEIEKSKKKRHEKTDEILALKEKIQQKKIELKELEEKKQKLQNEKVSKEELEVKRSVNVQRQKLVNLINENNRLRTELEELKSMLSIDESFDDSHNSEDSSDFTRTKKNKISQFKDLFRQRGEIGGDEEMENDEEVDPEVLEMRNKCDIKDLGELLKIKIGTEYFKEFLAEKLKFEPLLFYLDIVDYHNYASEENMEEWANLIYKKYVKPESLFEIDFPEEVSKQIEEIIKEEKVTLKMFDEAQQFVFEKMEKESFQNFKNSNLYWEFLITITPKNFYQFLPNGRNAFLVYEEVNTSALNLACKFEGKLRNPCKVILNLAENLMDVLNANYSISTEQIDCDALVKSIPFKKFQLATSELQKVSFSLLNNLTKEERLSFFLNVYNVLAIHAAVSRSAPTDRSSFSKFLTESIYKIGNFHYSLSDIKDGILMGNEDGRFKTPQRHFGENDERGLLSFEKVDPRLHFCFVNFNSQSSPFRVYYPDSLNTQIDSAVKELLNKHIKFHQKSKKIVLPYVFTIYLKDFGKDQTEVLNWISQFINVPQEFINNSTFVYKKPSYGLVIEFCSDYSSIK